MYVCDCVWLWMGFPVEWHIASRAIVGEQPIMQIIKVPEMACIKQHNLPFVWGLHFGEILEQKEKNLSCGTTLIFWLGSSWSPPSSHVSLMKEETRKYKKVSKIISKAQSDRKHSAFVGFVPFFWAKSSLTCFIFLFELW